MDAELATSFARTRARWARQGRRVRQLAGKADEIASTRLRGRVRERRRMLDKVREEVGYHDAWARWSATANELAYLTNQILSQPVTDLAELAVKFDALAWLLLGDDAVLDRAAERAVRSFSRDLLYLVKA